MTWLEGPLPPGMVAAGKNWSSPTTGCKACHSFVVWLACLSIHTITLSERIKWNKLLSSFLLCFAELVKESSGFGRPEVDILSSTLISTKGSPKSPRLEHTFTRLTQEKRTELQVCFCICGGSVLQLLQLPDSVDTGDTPPILQRVIWVPPTCIHSWHLWASE